MSKRKLRKPRSWFAMENRASLTATLGISRTSALVERVVRDRTSKSGQVGSGSRGGALRSKTRHRRRTDWYHCSSRVPLAFRDGYHRLLSYLYSERNRAPSERIERERACRVADTCCIDQWMQSTSSSSRSRIRGSPEEHSPSSVRKFDESLTATSPD